LSLIAGVAAAFVQSVLPVLLIGGLGYLVGRARTLDLGPIIGLAVLVLVPAIVFDSLARATLPRTCSHGSSCTWRSSWPGSGCSPSSSRAWSGGRGRPGEGSSWPRSSPTPGMSASRWRASRSDRMG
jgi:hypothetical protein